MTFNDLYPTMSWYNAPAEMQVDTEKELLIVTTKKTRTFGNKHTMVLNVMMVIF